MKTTSIYLFFIVPLLFSACESAEETNARLQKAEQLRIENAAKREEDSLRMAEAKKKAERIKTENEAKDRIIREERLEKERLEKEVYDKFIHNSLRNGATPYAYCYGENKSCNDFGCSQIKVKTPPNSDVLVTIKKDNRVVRHAYIAAGHTYTFEVPSGRYQPFFYYGKGWNPNKFMKETACGKLKGGFITDEQFGKDGNPQYLNNNSLEYELILQQNGNFSTSPSSKDDAL